jgi:hypothetical protein
MILQHQNTASYDLSLSAHYEPFSSPGWAIRTRKLSNPMSEKVKDFIEQVWRDSVKANLRVTPETIQEQIRSKTSYQWDQVLSNPRISYKESDKISLSQVK